MHRKNKVQNECASITSNVGEDGPPNKEVNVEHAAFGKPNVDTLSPCLGSDGGGTVTRLLQRRVMHG